MYDKYPVYDVPQNNLIQRFFAQSWSAIVLELAMTIVITVAAGAAFDFFGPFERNGESAADLTSATVVPLSVPLQTIQERATEYLANGRYQAAGAMYDLAISVAPTDASLYAWRGYTNMMTGDYAEAQRDLRQLLRLSPADYDGHNGLCWAYGELGHFTSALGHCNIALALAESPFQQALTLENRCWVGVEMGDYAAARADCAAVLQMLPACDHEVCALAHYNLGRVLMAGREVHRALRHFNLAVYIGSAYPDMYLEIAEVYATLGYNEAAQASYERYFALVGASAQG